MNKAMRAVGLGLGLVLGGCALRIRDVTLQNAQGQQVVCRGDTMVTPVQTQAAERLMRGCIQDFQRQGYERVPD
jgi:hypothetical protein